MAEFKVGDRVTVTTSYVGDRNIVGVSGEVVASERIFYLVEFDKNVGGHGGRNQGEYGHCWWVTPDDLVLINGEKSMANVNFEEKLRQQELSEDNKALIERGLMNDDLTLTSDGKAAFSRYQFNKNKADFVKEVVALDPPKPAEKA